MDAWTSKNQLPFLGISVHWINEKWELKCTTLDFCILSGPHTGANLSQKFLEILQDFGIATKVNLYLQFNISSNIQLMNCSIVDFSNRMRQRVQYGCNAR